MRRGGGGWEGKREKKGVGRERQCEKRERGEREKERG